MYVISGISGNTGSAAAKALLAAGQPVRALVRNAGRAASWRDRGVELVDGDMTDAESLARAFDGAKGAYALVPPSPDHPDPLGYYRQVADAVRHGAASAGLERLVFLSSEGAHLPHGTGPILGAHYAEEVLTGSVRRTTFLRPSFFQQNWQPVYALAAARGIMPSMLQPLDAARPQVATADIGETVAALLAEPAPPSIVELSGPAAYSARDAAAVMTHALGREVAAVAVPRDGWAEMLAGAGLGQAYVALVCEMYDAINSGRIGFSGEGDARRRSPVGRPIQI
jgi:uncharacterized protein YbjT (DUF2867 family)